MKTYNEMADSVFEKIEAYEAEKKRRQKLITKITVTTSCAALIMAIGAVSAVSLFRNNMPIANGITEDGVKAEGEMFDGNDTMTGTWWVPEGDELNDTNLAESSTTDEASESEEFKNAIGNAPFIGVGEDIPDIEYETFIDAYPSVDTNACYKTPENGAAYLSIPLKAAIGEYGDEATYNVRIYVFRNGSTITDAKSLKLEFERMKDLGYTSVFETRTNQGVSTYALAMHASAEDLLTFQPSSDYGYMFFLYNEETHEEQGW